MLNIKKLSIIALLLLVVGVVGCLLTFKAAFQAEPIHEERTFKEESIKHIDIESDNATIEILPTSESDILVELTGTNAKGRKSDFNTKVKGDTLSIKVDEARVKFFNFTLREYELQLNVYLPEKVYESLDVDLVNGSVDAQGLHVNEVSAKTVNGEINIENIVATYVKVESTNGEINLEHVSGDLTGEVVNGEISIVTDNLDENMNLETVNGKINVVTMEEPKNVTIKANTVNGDVQLFGERDYHFVIGNGDNLVQIETVNGDISVGK